MTNEYERRPFELVEINFGSTDYRIACDTYGGGSHNEIKWIELANQLVGRPGWHFDIANSGEALWSFGDFGGSTLNISIEDDTFNCYSHLTDDSEVLPDIGSVLRWVDTLEPSAKKYPIHLAKAFNWGALRAMPFLVRVDAIDEKFCVGIKGMSEITIFADSVADAVADAKNKIIDYFQAPEELADELTIRLEINEAATRLLLSRNPI